MVNYLTDFDSYNAGGLRLTQKTEETSQSDLTLWGIAALVSVAFAVLLVNISGAIPSPLLDSLHTTRSQSGNITALSGRLAELEAETLRIRQENSRMQTMLNISDQDQGNITRRLGALEDTVPAILEELQTERENIDRSTITASISEEEPAPEVDEQTVKTDRPDVSVTMKPLIPELEKARPEETAILTPKVPQSDLPNPIAPVLDFISTDDFGIAMGPAVGIRNAGETWNSIRAKVGALLVDLDPILINGGSGSYRLVAGPIPQLSDAERLCERISASGVTCLPAPYDGVEMPR